MLLRASEQRAEVSKDTKEGKEYLTFNFGSDNQFWFENMLPTQLAEREEGF